MTDAADFFTVANGPPRQGDILLAGVSRLVAVDRCSPPGWEQLDLYDVRVSPDDGEEPPLRIAAGPALVMVTSHDCHFDKDWNRRRGQLIREGLGEAEAESVAGADPALDRTFNASPLIRPADVDRSHDDLTKGRVLGYLPVPASDDGAIPEAVVDLTYRVTLDRLDVRKIVSVSEVVRTQLRYVLARLDSLRATKVGFDLEDVVGRRIVDVTFPTRDPLSVKLHLEGGSVITLLQQPAEPDDDGPARTQVSNR